MYISQQLRKKNIAEYILYMWQVEDLIRAYGCSITRLQKEYISLFNYSEEQKEDMLDWYGDLINMMNQEGKSIIPYKAFKQVSISLISLSPLLRSSTMKGNTL